MLHRMSAWAHAHIASQCAVCHAWPARPVCDACVTRFAQPEPRCRTCALPLPPAGLDQCGACVRQPPPLARCIAAVRYGYPWSACLAQLKFRQSPGWAHALGLLLRSAPWAEPALDAADRVVPMPLSTTRLRERGFNQALELARCVAPDKTDAHLLVRWRHTPAQTTLGRAERLRNVAGAFTVDPLRAASVRGQHLVVVDDTMTSGASVFAAAQALRDAGAAGITALVVARTDAH